jgi:hypothetical protein
MGRNVPGVILLLPIALSAAAMAVQVPLAVSPGDPSKLARTSSACPTFSWGGVAAATSYELVVYRLRDEGVEKEPRLRQTFSGSVDSWTPSLDRCLERGGRYGWSVRAISLEQASGWSPPRLFEVAYGPSLAELEAALAVIRRHLAPRPGSSPSGDAGTQVAEGDGLRAAGQRAGSLPDPRVVAATRLSVDGGVVATSFTGDGSTLTDLDPASFTSGAAHIDITGSSTLLNCFGCVESTHIGTGQVASSDIGDGEVTGTDIDSSTVQARVSGSCGSDGAIRTVANDGSPTCTTLTGVLRGQEYLVSSLGGAGSKIVLVPRANRICFLSYVGMEDQNAIAEHGRCEIKEFTDPSNGDPFWLLEAYAQGNSDALCGMRCIEISPDRT